MKKLNITKEQVRIIVKTGGKIALGVLAIALPYFTRDNIATVKCYIGEASYSDAVDVILGSSMFDSSKTKIMGLLKRDGDAEYYKSVITAVNSNMFDSSKIRTIEMLSEK